MNRHRALLQACIVAIVLPCMCLGALTAYDCLQAYDPHPMSMKTVATSDSSIFFATSYGTVGQAIDIRLAGGSWSAKDSAANATELPNPRTSNCFLPTGQTELASLTWGKSMDAAGSVFAIGAPTKRMPGQVNFYSAIDVFVVTQQDVTNPTPPGPTPSTNMEFQKDAASSKRGLPATPAWITAADATNVASIDDVNAPWLGLSVSLTSDGSMVASLYDMSNVALFKTQGRTTSKYNTLTDYKLALPTGFVPDSVSYRGQTVAITGSTTQADGSCRVSLVVYSRPSSSAAWTSETTLILRSEDAAQSTNAVACPTGPANSFPVQVSDDGVNVVLSVKEWRAVYAGPAATFHDKAHYLVQIDTPKISTFGMGVGFAYTPAVATSRPAITVLSKTNLFTFLLEDFYTTNPPMTDAPEEVIFTPVSAQFAAIFPNRQQQPKALDEGRHTVAPVEFLDFGVTGGFAVGVTKYAMGFPIGQSTSDDSAFLLMNPSAPEGHQWHVDLKRFVECPAGYFQDGEGGNPASMRWVPSHEWAAITALPQASVTNDTYLLSGSLQQPCAPCPLGTYQDTEGQRVCKPPPADAALGSVFLPPGSIYPYSDDELGTPGYESGIGEFETESLTEAFEELVVNKIFNPSNPSMAACICLVGGALFLLLLHWVPCFPIRVRNFGSATLNLFLYANLPETPEEHAVEEMMHEKKDQIEAEKEAEKEAVQHEHDAHGHGAQIHDSHGHADAHGHGQAAAHGHGHGGHGHMSYKDAVMSNKLQHIHVHHCLIGFFNILFLILLIATLVFAIQFLSYYHPNEPCGKAKNNCVAADILGLTDGLAPEYSTGFAALGAVQANMFLDIIGLTGINPSGSEICSAETFLDLRVSGCSIGGSTQLCNDTTMFEVGETEAPMFMTEDLSTEEFLHPQATKTCRLRWNIIIGTSFQVNMDTQFVLPSFVTWSSLRFFYLQSPQKYDPNVDPDTSVVKSHDYEIGHTNFVENVQRPTDGSGGSIALDAFPPSYTLRQWTYGVQGREIQVSSDIPVDYHRTWWNSVSSSGSNSSVITYRSWIQDASPITMVHVAQTSNYVTWRHQSVAKLVQPSLAFLTILLGLIGVLHLVKFGLEVTEVAVAAWHHAKIAKEMAKDAGIKATQHVGSALGAVGDKLGLGKDGGVTHVGAKSADSTHSIVNVETVPVHFVQGPDAHAGVHPVSEQELTALTAHAHHSPEAH